MNAKEKLTKARTALILDHPFFACLALRMPWEASGKYETCVTDGKGLYYNPEFIDGLTVPQAAGMLAHEVLHAALGHAWRMGSRKIGRWNAAADFAINNELKRAGFELPDDKYMTGYEDLSAEEIYEKLPDDDGQGANSPPDGSSPQGGQGSSQPQSGRQPPDSDTDGQADDQPSDPGGCGGVIQSECDENEQQQQEAEWRAAMSQASKTQGNLPAGLQRMVESVLVPDLPWYVLLRDFVERTARNDYSWSKPSRRYFGSGIVLPSLISEELPEVMIAIDTSGSIDQEQLDLFAAEVSGVLEAYQTTIRVVYCDTEVKNEQVLTQQDLPFEAKPVGGGGTDFRPVFDYIREKAYTPCCVIYFTDMYGQFPEQEPEYPTLWVTTTKDRQAPFGQTVKF